MRAPKRTFQRARQLRRDMTLPEIVLWQALRKLRLADLRFRRQHPIGPYILDFYCPSAHLALEVDGFAHDSVAQAQRDERRQEWLALHGVRALRIRASDVLTDENLEGVPLEIKEMASGAPSDALGAPPPPQSGGGA